MEIGTKSLLFGAHCLLIHPFCVALGWWKLYGFKTAHRSPSLLDPRLWVVFFLHDIGYWGCPNMDGKEGKEHPRVGAAIMHALFDRRQKVPAGFKRLLGPDGEPVFSGLSRTTKDGCVKPYLTATPAYKAVMSKDTYWHDLSLYHSRSIAKADGKPVSQLCAADKLATALVPWWLYIPMVTATGEVNEYLEQSQLHARESKSLNAEELDGMVSGDKKRWFKGFQSYVKRWADNHRWDHLPQILKRDDEWSW